jgi:putative flippase GtrA
VVVIYNALGFDKLIAYVAAAIIGVPVTFLFLKFFAFRPQTEGG